MGKCKWCYYGTMSVGDGSGLTYRCPDCGGTGYIPECDLCGEEYRDDYCEDCYGECAECGEIVPLTELKNDICECCVEAMEEEGKQK